MMHKLLVIVLLGALIGLVVWDVSMRPSMPETRTRGSNFKWVSCPSCNRIFTVEKTQRNGWCPYDGVQFDFSFAE